MNNQKPKNKNKNVNKRLSKTAEKYPSTWIVQRLCPMPPTGAFDNKIYNTIDNYYLASVLTTSSTVPTNVSLNFVGSSFSNFANLSSAFDQYRITAIEFTLLPQISVPSSTITGHIFSVIDYDDSNPILTPTDALQYSNVITSDYASTLVRSFRPHIAISAYNGSFSGFANADMQWIDSATSDVQHYGVKIVATVTGLPLSYDMAVKAHFQYRNPR
jgi:hypothetical protein